MRPVSDLSSTKLRRSRPRTSTVISAISGTTANAASASRQLIHSITATMPMSMKISLNRFTSTSENSSFKVSTSLVARVTSRPEEKRSSVAMDMCWMCVNTRRRMSIRMLCPMRLTLTASVTLSSDDSAAHKR